MTEVRNRDMLACTAQHSTAQHSTAQHRLTASFFLALLSLNFMFYTESHSNGTDSFTAAPIGWLSARFDLQTTMQSV